VSGTQTVRVSDESLKGSEPHLQGSRSYAKLPAGDIDRAVRFYQERLGLTPSRELAPGHYLFECGGAAFLLFRSQGKASGTHDQMGWFVTDVAAEVARLKALGVSFAVFDYPGNTWHGEIADNGIRRSAWFYDSEGNLLNVVQLLESPSRSPGTPTPSP